MTVSEQRRKEEARGGVGGGSADSEETSEATRSSYAHRESIKKLPPQSQTKTISATEPTPLTWYAALAKTHSTSDISLDQQHSPSTLPVSSPSTNNNKDISPMPPSFSSSNPLNVQHNSSSKTVSPHSNSPNSPKRQQSIPISFLIHPTSESPQHSTPISPLPRPQPSSSEQSSIIQIPSKKIEDHESRSNGSTTLYWTHGYPAPSSKPAEPLSKDLTCHSSAVIHTHLPIKYHQRLSGNEHLTYFKAPRSRRHESVAFSDQTSAISSHSRPSTLCNEETESLSLKDAEGMKETMEDENPKQECTDTWRDFENSEDIPKEIEVVESDALSKQPSIRRTNNPNVKTTKTGKIRHRSSKIGVNKKSTAYNRFLQQRSKALAEQLPDLSPQQRMKRIAEEWAVSEKNQHKTRRKSRFLGPNGELNLPLTSASSTSAGAASSIVNSTNNIESPSLNNDT